jgi:phosphate starvation-inducible protein PhoH and related proteins
MTVMSKPAPQARARRPPCATIESPNAPILMIVRHLFSPLNNTRLAHLCGPMDSHLRTVEQALQVKIAHRHEQFKVDGTKAACKRGMEILQALYEIAARPIEPATVQLMLAGDADVREGDGPALKTKRSDLKPRTLNQATYLDNMASHDITFGIGPAGTGKTYLAVAMAVDALMRSSVQRIVLTRPAVEAGERLGYLPGDLAQKIDPYLRPLYDALYDLMGFDAVQKALERQTIEIAPLGFMRGRTLNSAFIILDEAQNTTPEQMKMFLTRIGFGAKAVITGDVSQIDLPKTQLSGLIDAERVLRRTPGIAICRLTSADVVRHPLVARIVDAYDSPRSAT